MYVESVRHSLLYFRDKKSPWSFCNVCTSVKRKSFLGTRKNISAMCVSRFTFLFCEKMTEKNRHVQSCHEEPLIYEITHYFSLRNPDFCSNIYSSLSVCRRCKELHLPHSIKKNPKVSTKTLRQFLSHSYACAQYTTKGQHSFVLGFVPGTRSTQSKVVKNITPFFRGPPLTFGEGNAVAGQRLPASSHRSLLPLPIILPLPW